MIKPNKHTLPDKTIIHAATAILPYMRKNSVISFDGLKQYLLEKSPGCEALFIPTLEFLFLLGRIDYLSKNDAIVYKDSK